jgi:hypothetical protein
METKEQRVEPHHSVKKTGLISHLWISKMKILDLELLHLNELFSRASFLLVKEDFQRISYFRKKHSDLQIAIATHGRRIRHAGYRFSRNTRKLEVETRSQLDQELQELTEHLRAFNNRLFKRPRRSCL